MARLRADLALQARGLAESREQAQRLITAGRVRSGTLVLVKASQMIADDAPLSLTEPERYVSRGGLKLEAALHEFAIDPTGLICLDLGASTGGFTDCLLQHGAARVIAVDVGRAQLHQSLRDDPRVLLLEKTNARDLPDLGTTNGEPPERRQGKSPETLRRQLRTTDHLNGGLTNIPADPAAPFEVRRSESDANGQRLTANGQQPAAAPTLFAADLSFISLRKVLPSVANRLAPGTAGVVLLKPQFEAGPKDVPRGGVIKDEAVLERVRSEFAAWLASEGWQLFAMIPSPIRGGDGNTEYLCHVATPGEPRTTNHQNDG